ncbi:MAG: ATP-binding protein [Candidatus Sabulitectum sp.]|nr:ATP-binding protein [Candidatus Sabulitectum sp.]
MIKRKLESKLKDLASKYPVLTLTGPRQSGKTTLVKSAFPGRKYVSLEDLDHRAFAQEDPRGFLRSYPRAIIDEVQNVPELFSYIQTKVDEDQSTGQYILTGSQNFLLFEKITQSLAGRVAVLKLLPFSYAELTPYNIDKDYEYFLYNGFYPRVYDKKIPAEDFYPSYVQTYVERDVRMIRNIGNISRFQHFLKLCAARTGQLLNFSALANDCGISHTTASQWISILEASYIVFLLRPHHRNFNKRLVKMPKLYFYDTGLATYLLGIHSIEQLSTHYSKGALFESFAVSEFVKNAYNRGREPHCFFWRDKTGNEIDLLIEDGSCLFPVEIKSGKTVNQNFFKGLKYWRRISDSNESGIVIYGGDRQQERESFKVITWQSIETLSKQQ